MKNHLAVDAAEPAISLNVISFYRHHARRCETAARNASNAKMRAHLSKMVHVWRKFAVEHEKIVREGSDLNVRLGESLRGWM